MSWFTVPWYVESYKISRKIAQISSSNMSSHSLSFKQFANDAVVTMTKHQEKDLWLGTGKLKYFECNWYKDILIK